jgi:predicted O-methyltransferase YrrM
MTDSQNVLTLGTSAPSLGHAWRRMDPTLEQVLADYEARQAEEAVLMARMTPQELGLRRDELLVSVGRSTGMLLNLLARESGAQSILELGTSFGYGTIWLADAARETGGRVLTIDVAAEKQQYARSALARVGLADHVEYHLGDAIAFLNGTQATFDFVLLDLWKDAYIPGIDALLGHLIPGATIVADNMLEPAFVRPGAERYRAYLRRLPDLESVLLPVGSGLAISRYKVAASPAAR